MRENIYTSPTLILAENAKKGKPQHFLEGAFRSAYYFADAVGPERTAEVLAMTDQEFSALIKERMKLFRGKPVEEVK